MSLSATVDPLTTMSVMRWIFSGLQLRLAR
jgi:hypothetical protein